ncbi:hypothetical protein BC835DRAFT_1264905 [Cytidiella melzeri]|nr:hypothetical protein BC835DRAFT_1264905 [Cytidiella melzeri]
MSSSRFASLFLSSNFRCRGSAFQSFARPPLYCKNFARGFRQNAANRLSDRVTQQKTAEVVKSDEQAMKELETMLAVAHRTHLDIWSAPVTTLDVYIPNWLSKRPNASILDHWRSFVQSQRNWLRNVQNMYQMAKQQAFPDIKVKSPWSLQIFRVRTTPWLAGLRRAALEVYSSVNQAVAANDTKTIRKYTIESYRDVLLKRLQAQDKNNHYVWTLHGENAPCQVLSIRSFQGHLGPKVPQFGHRLVIQALVKFDTNQSLQVYNKRGKLIAGDGKQQRVVEYLVLQRRGWYDGPWTIRDQLYEDLDNKLTPLT